MGLLARCRREFLSVFTRRAIRRGVFESVAELQATIRVYLQRHNADPTPFVWTKLSEPAVMPLQRETGWHSLGSVRMGDDPRNSVVDSFGRSHDVPNLFVMDGSVTPNVWAVNPTGTVAALALRKSDAIIENRRSQPVSKAAEALRVGS
ncbi:GMC family oxidoreductase [Mesorhizobium sp. M1405]|uniref:GMC family oxidoreductase n=1 Tax=Mesorhizobium sp. M1405 TaxID=2957098 RepID=UPI003338EE31